MNLKIRRQHSIDKFIADFYCDELKLIIEVDGLVHDNQGQANYDYSRDEWLKSKGFHDIRINNVSVIEYPEATLNWLQQKVENMRKNGGRKIIPAQLFTLSAFDIFPKGEKGPKTFSDRYLTLILT